MISYEWEYRIEDEHGDIIDLDYEPDYRDPVGDEKIALAKYYGDDIHGITDRSWAYPGDQEFDDGSKILKKYLRNL